MIHFFEEAQDKVFVLAMVEIRKNFLYFFCFSLSFFFAFPIAPRLWIAKKKLRLEFLHEPTVKLLAPLEQGALQFAKSAHLLKILRFTHNNETFEQSTPSECTTPSRHAKGKKTHIK